MSGDGVKTTKAMRFFRGWSTVVGIVSAGLGVYLQMKGVDPNIAAAFGALGVAKIAQPDQPIGKFGL